MSAKQAKYGVFISYCHEDAQYVSPIVDIISASRPDLVFQDTKAIVKGKKWGPQLQEALDEASLVIVFWCKHSAHSQYVKDEYEKAIQTRKDILPVLLDDCDLDPHLADYQWIDLQNVTTHQKSAAVPAPGKSIPVLRYKKLVLVFFGLLILSATFFLVQRSNKSAVASEAKHGHPDNVSLDTMQVGSSTANTDSAAQPRAEQLHKLVLAKQKSQQDLAQLVQQMRKQPAHYNRRDRFHADTAERLALQSKLSRVAAVTDSLNREMEELYAGDKADPVARQSIRKLHARQQRVNQQLVESVLQPSNDTALQSNVHASRAVDDSLTELLAKAYPRISNGIPNHDSDSSATNPPVVTEQGNKNIYTHPVFIAIMVALLLGVAAIARSLFKFAQKQKHRTRNSNIAAETLMNEINLKLPATETGKQ